MQRWGGFRAIKVKPRRHVNRNVIPPESQPSSMPVIDAIAAKLDRPALDFLRGRFARPVIQGPDLMRVGAILPVATSDPAKPAESHTPSTRPA